MDDILGQGGDRQPGPWPRRLAVIVALLLVTGVVIWHLPRHRHNPVPPGRARAVAGPAQRPAPGPVPLAAGLTNEPDGVTGQTLPWDRTARLPVTGEQPAWFWPATGLVTPIGGLPREVSGYQFIRVAGGWAIQANPGARPARAGCGTCAGPPQPVYFLGAGARSVTQVGVARKVAPGAVPGTVWLTSYPAGADMGTTAGAAREVSVAGAPLGPQVRLPAGYAIVQATDRGLLLTPVAQHPGATAYRLWDPAAPQASRAFDGVIAASAGEIAWMSGCSPVCRVQVLDLATGRGTTIGLAGASAAASGAFSPDGDYLALEVSFYNGGDAGALALQLDVASTASGRVTVVPGTWASSDALVGFGWPVPGDTLIAELSFTTKVQVASWRPGAARLAIAVNRPGPTSDALIVG